MPKNTTLENLFTFQILQNLKDSSHYIAKEMNKSGSRIIIKNHSTNNGLKKSIITGCDYLSKNYDSFIVIEDDCVIYENFFNYMKNITSLLIVFFIGLCF